MTVVLHKVTTLIGFKLIMRPKGVVEGKVTMFAALRVLRIEKSRHISNHIDTKLAIEVTLALVEWSYSHAYLDTH